MSAPRPSQLDYGQTLQGAFDEATGSFRVNAQLTSTIIPPPGLEVSISSLDDSILVVGTEDATTTGVQHVLKVNADGSIDVNATVTLAPNSSVNLSQVGGVTTAVNNGTANNGTLRVTIASDSSPLTITGTISVNPITFASPQHVIVDSGTIIANIGTTGGLALDSSLSTINTTLGSPFQAGGSIGNTTFASTQSGTWNINNITGTISLPTGASTSSLQSTGNTSLASILSNQTNGTQQTQVTNFPATVAVTQSTSPWVVSGTVTSNIGTTGGLALDTTVSGLLTNTQLRATPIAVSGSISFISPQHIILDSGTVTANAGTGTFLVDGSAHTQPVSGTITANIGTTGGLALDTTVSGLLTNTQLRASPVPVSGTIIANQGTSPWVVSGSITTSPNVNVHDGSGVSIGSTGSSLNVDVTNTVPVSQSGSWSVTANIGITGGLALDSSLSTINTTLGTLLTNTQLRASPVPISGTIAVSNFPADADALAQGSATSGQLGALIMGAVTTSAPSYTTAQTSPLSLTLAGLLRVDGSGVTQPISGTITANIGTTGGLALDSSLTTINTTLGGLLTNTQLRASPVPISGTVAVSNFPAYDTNYGTVGANTLRTASEIGNATGAANFGAGATGAQTLRVSANISDGAGTALTSTLFNSKQSLDVRPNTGFATGSNTRPAVTNASSTILASNVNRLFAYISNNSGSTIFLKFGVAAVINQGILLPNLAIYEINADNLWTGSIQAIKNGASSVNIDVFEGTI